MSELIETLEMPPVPALARVAGVEECTAEIDGIRWRYLRAGKGPALLLVHGVTAYSFSWRFVIQGLARRYTVYAVDLPGCGFSQRSSMLPGTLASDAEHLLGFMDHLGIDEFDVLGTSRGGGAAIAMAGLAAERGELHRIRRMVLSAPINPWSRIGFLRVRFLRTVAGRLYLTYVEPQLPSLVKMFFKRLFGDPSRVPADSLAGYQAGWEPEGSLRHLWMIVRSWMTDLGLIESLLPLVKSVPALLLWGDRDVAVEPASAEEVHRRWDNSEVAMMHGVGHMPYEEVPEEFNRIALDFLMGGTSAVSLRKEMQPEMAYVVSELRHA
jgi:pimeloyl-ACP methyl ester carboxylesterase